MKNKSDQITYNVQALREIARTDLEFLELYRRGKQYDGTHVVREFIDYAEGNVNWCDEDLAFFEQKLLKPNPTFSDLVDFLTTNGFDFFTEEEFGTLWVISRCMLSDVCVVGVADEFDKSATNSWNESMRQMEYAEAKSRKNRFALKRGPKLNDYRALYARWICRLHGWLSDDERMKDNKAVLVLIGLLLSISGFQELRQQFELLSPIRRYEKKEGGKEDIKVPYTEYLHGRMKTIFNSLRPLLQL